MRRKEIQWIWAGVFSSLALVVNAATPPVGPPPSNSAECPGQGSSYVYNPGMRDPKHPSNYVQAGQLNSFDYNFLVHAALLEMVREQAGEMAQQRSMSLPVRDAGGQMLDSGSQTITELREIAAQKGAVLPTQLQSPQRADILSLERLSGPDFDRTFARVTVRRDTRAVKQVEVAANRLSDPDLRNWAHGTLARLQKRLQKSESIEVAVRDE